jgi:hypothetical protein
MMMIPEIRDNDVRKDSTIYAAIAGVLGDFQEFLREKKISGWELSMPP